MNIESAFGVLVFVEEGKAENHENPLEDEDQEQTQPSYDARLSIRSPDTLMGSGSSPLGHVPP